MTEDVRTALRAHLATYVGPQASAWLFPDRDSTAPVIHRTFSRCGSGLDGSPAARIFGSTTSDTLD